MPGAEELCRLLDNAGVPRSHPPPLSYSRPFVLSQFLCLAILAMMGVSSLSAEPPNNISILTILKPAHIIVWTSGFMLCSDGHLWLMMLMDIPKGAFMGPPLERLAVERSAFPDPSLWPTGLRKHA